MQNKFDKPVLILHNSIGVEKLETNMITKMTIIKALASLYSFAVHHLVSGSLVAQLANHCQMLTSKGLYFLTHVHFIM